MTNLSRGKHRCRRSLGVIFLLLGLYIILGAEEPGFSFATPERKLEFPRDHGSHPDFKIEWWYITGHLLDQSERRFGFESTFFRLVRQSGSDFPQIYMAHMAVSDLESGKFYHEERFNREGWNAYSKVGDLDTRNGNWNLMREKDGTMELNGSVQSKCRFSLQLRPQKQHVIFGKNGVCRKGKSKESASYYITWPRLETAGTLRIGGKEFVVSGSAWMDHEISSNQLDVDQTGWDWIGIQFDDGRELMAYLLRLKKGGYSEFSKMVWIDEDGTLTHQTPDQFQWNPGGEWKSVETGAVYPIRPTFTTEDPKSGKKRTFRIVPLMENQEMTGKLAGVPYWEGTCNVVDETGGLVGKAYLELAGYVEGLAERLR